MASDGLESVAGLPVAQADFSSHFVGVEVFGVWLGGEMGAADVNDVPGEGQAVEGSLALGTDSSARRPYLSFAGNQKQVATVGVELAVLGFSQVKQAEGVAADGLRGVDGEGFGSVRAEAFDEIEIRGLAQLQ